ncbi:MAG TPA: hypothetical protein VKA98_10725 [Nitrososphaeraceae archaeon]|nr:hypothetical protein [Nitrososphaeraceae archaeon]
MVKKKIADDENEPEPEEQEDEELENNDTEEKEDEEETDEEATDTNADNNTGELDDTPPKPEKVGNIDSLVFLKEYSRDIKRQYSHVATKIGIGKSSAYKYLQKYLYLVKETMSDADFPRRARLVLNKNVPEKYQITVDEIIKLKPLLWIYGKVPPPAVDAQPYNQSDSAYTYDNMSFDP